MASVIAAVFRFKFLFGFIRKTQTYPVGKRVVRKFSYM